MARLAAKPGKVYQQSSDEEEYENEFHSFSSEEEVIGKRSGSLSDSLILTFSPLIKVQPSGDEEEEDDNDENDEELDEEEEEDDEEDEPRPDIQELKRSMQCLSEHRFSSY